MDRFFVARYFEQRVSRENSHMPVVHELSGICIINFKLVEFNIRPVGQLMYYFIPLPLNPLSDGRQFVLAYELEDPEPGRHLVLPGQPDHYPLFLVAGDVMMVHAGHGDPHNIVAIRNVQAKNSQQPPIDNNSTIFQENENLVGKVDVNHLTQQPRNFKFEASLHVNATLY